MSKLWKAVGIAERALRKIGAFAINDTAADPEELSETLYWMDLVVGELAGTEECQWLVPATLSITLVADTVTYDLADSVDALPADGLLFPVGAWLRDSSGVDTPLALLRRQDYEDISDKDAGGTPKNVYVDRLTNDGTLSVHPVPSATGYSVRLVCQQYAPNLTAGTGDQAGNLAHGFAQEWQRYLVLATAAEIGAGPVRRLPVAEVADMRAQAAASLAKLMVFSNRERASKPRRTRASGA